MPRIHHLTKPGFVIDNTTTPLSPKPMQRGFTLVLMFSRPWCVRPFFQNLDKMRFARRKCHLLVYNNTNDPFLDRLLIRQCQRAMSNHRLKFSGGCISPPYASVRLYKSFRRYGGIVFGQEAAFDKSKLPTIYEMQKDIVPMITTKTFLMIEDDTLPPPHAYVRLMKKLKSNSKIGLVSGVEPTRSPRLTDKVRLGAYYLDRRGGKIYERISLDPRLRGFADVDAVGFYCNAVRTEAWKEAFAIMERELEKQKTAEPNWAIDTLWTNDVQRAGWRVIADMDTPCLHMQSLPDRIFYWAVDKAVPKLDYWIEKYGVYAQGVDVPRNKTSS